MSSCSQSHLAPAWSVLHAATPVDRLNVCHGVEFLSLDAYAAYTPQELRRLEASCTFAAATRKGLGTGGVYSFLPLVRFEMGKY